MKDRFKRSAWLKKNSLNWPAPVYVLLLAAFPVLYLYAYNIAETKFEEATLPLALSLAGAVVLWALLTLILRNARKAGIAVAIFLFFFFTYGRFYETLEYSGMFVPKHAHLLPVMLFVWGYCVYFISRAKRDFRTTTTVLNVAAVVLIAINLFNIASYQIKLARQDTGTPQESHTQDPAVSDLTELDTLPDIYFIVADEYAHPDSMKEWYDYDNSEFINSLEDKGFFIASQSKTRSSQTPLCLAQILSMEYLTPGMTYDASKKGEGGCWGMITDSDEEYPDDPIWSDANYRRIAYSRVADFLWARGYEFVYFGCQIGVNRWDVYMEDSADVYFNYFRETETKWISEFQETLWTTTMLRPFYYYLVGNPYEATYRRQTLYTLEHLKEMPEEQGPKFVFVHMMCPHTPIVFGPEGEYISSENRQNLTDKQFYLGQYIFMSTELEKVADALLEKSEIPPIIILQSDHGLRPRCRDPEGPDIGTDEWRKILNVMYLPGMDYSELSESISPVNTFRLIFSHYFGADYPLLEDD